MTSGTPPRSARETTYSCQYERRPKGPAFCWTTMLCSVATSNGSPSTRPETGASTGLAGIPSTAPGASPKPGLARTPRRWAEQDSPLCLGQMPRRYPGPIARPNPWREKTVKLTGTLAGGGLADVVEHAASELARINARPQGQRGE